MEDAWNLPLLEDDDPTPYGPKEPPKAKNAGPLRSRAAGTRDLNSGGDSGTEWAPGERMALNPIGAPPLDWWEIPWEAVCDRIIRAMVPERVCNTCGEPSRRITEQSEEYRAARAAITAGEEASQSGWEAAAWGGGKIGRGGGSASLISNGKISAAPITVGFSDCGHNDWRPGVVLDPFGKVTAEVATALGRDAIGIELALEE